MEEMNYNLLFRWFVGLEMDDEVWDVTVFTKNRERLIAGEVAQKFFAAVLKQARSAALLSDETFHRGRNADRGVAVGAVLRRSQSRRSGAQERAAESCCATRTSRRPIRRRAYSGGARRRNRGRVIWDT